MTPDHLPGRVLLSGCLFLLAAMAVRAAETEIRYLSGTGPADAVEWDFFCTAGRNSLVWSRIAVPSCWEQQGFGTYSYGRDLGTAEHPLPNEQGMYRYRFDVPESWRGKNVRIVFDGSMTDTSVWINGQSAGVTHQGAFYRFHHDITGLLKYGESNLLEVTVAKVSSNKSVNEAEREADYWVFGGIFRPVWLEAAPARFIARTAIDAEADGSFLAEVFLGAPASAAGQITAQVIASDGQPVAAPLTVSVARGATQASVRGRFSGMKTWTAETPNLYRVNFDYTVAGAGGPGSGPGHTVTERFGFRTLEVRENDGVYLNGTKIVLKGINRHCFWPETGRTVSREQSYADARLIKEANMNAVRMSHYPPDKHFLEACDELGLYVLDELAGWQADYDTPTGRRLIGELIRRDVNHPSILFWDNGNEGGWNTNNDGEFAKWDPQNRPVLHPWAVFSGINTDHYENYDSTVNLSAGPQIFMPTEMLHGLFDGGIGAGLHDYWEVMGRSPTVAGAFFWVWSDEGVVRTDQNGRIDNAGNQAPDGIVGPHREKEGSYFTVKEIWSPVQITVPNVPGHDLPANWDGALMVENQYDFTALDQCSLNWRIVSGTNEDGSLAAEAKPIASGRVKLPPIAPRTTGAVKLSLPADWQTAGNILQVTAHAPGGAELWTWSWSTFSHGFPNTISSRLPQTIPLSEGDTIQIEGFSFDRATGLLREVQVDGRTIPFGNGPRLVAYRRDGTSFVDVGRPSKLIELVRQNNNSLRATYDGPLHQVRWNINGNQATLSYEYEFEGAVDLLGVQFDYPAERVQAKRWLGSGPYRVYRNRMEGGVIDVWSLDYNDPTPGQTYAYPEFRGYFRDVDLLALDTADGPIAMEVFAPFVGLYSPRDGEPSMLAFPETGISFLHVIPSIGTKFKSPDTLGPQGKTPRVSGVKTGSVRFSFKSP